ncbi:MAG: DapH/DapD/GlmU-related protein [Dehalococcoidia bacterium]|nr:DapH/DapD/GlmU-related protein [Dehalococcoidia bacterium]
MKKWISLSLSGGKSSRFKSSEHKALHKLSGKITADIIISTIKNAGIVNNAIVVPEDLIKKFADNLDKKTIIVSQKHAYGTGDAIKVSRKIINNYKYSLIINGDLPLITTRLIKKIIKKHEQNNSVMTVTTVSGKKYSGYGKMIIKNSIVEKIEENAPYSESDKLNAGIYAVDNLWLLNNINKIQKASNKELQFTSILEIARKNNQDITLLHLGNTDEALQINTDEQLDLVSKKIQNNINAKLINKGVQIQDSNTTYIQHDVTIKAGTIILPNTFIEKDSIIGKDCTIGPGAVISNSQVGNNAHIVDSRIIDSTLKNNVKIGPYSHIRPKSLIMNDVTIGTNVEIKNSTIGNKSKIGHFAYIGDSELKQSVNIGAGTVTANYSGMKKHKTSIGSNTFIGSNSTLIAPVVIGNNAYVGAGSVINKNIPNSQTWVGNPGKLLK